MQILWKFSVMLPEKFCYVYGLSSPSGLNTFWLPCQEKF